MVLLDKQSKEKWNKFYGFKVFKSTYMIEVYNRSVANAKAPNKKVTAWLALVL